MNKNELANKIRGIDGLTNDEKSALIELLRKQKKYGLVWEDKPEDVEERLREELPVLIEDTGKAIICEDADAPNHILIEGDNLEALTALAYTHEGKIDVIYIDPPYNTGNKDFVYNDQFVDKEDSYRHSKWLSFMSKRLRIAKRLLSDKGVIFISIDDNEQAQLKLLCDEIFGGNNFIATLIWAAGRKNDSKHVSISHEYILCYVCSIEYLKQNNIVWKEKKQGIEDIYKAATTIKRKCANDYKMMSNCLKEWYKTLPDNHPAKNHSHYNCIDERGIYFPSDISWPGGGGPKYTILHPITHKPVKIPNRGWVYPTKERMDEIISMGLVHFGEDENSVPCKKTYLSENEYSTPYSVFYQDGRAATKRLRNLMGYAAFQNPKDEEILQNLLSFSSTKESTILDFFAGSGTTLHATMQLNAEDGGKRKCILVTNNENNICEEVTYERNKRVIQGYTTPKGTEVAGLTANTLRYYKTNLILRDRTPRNMRALVAASTDLLCIKNDIYKEAKLAGRNINPKIARHFAEGGRSMLVIYDERAISAIAEILETVEPGKEKIKVYVFSAGSYAYDDEFEEVADKVELCALPDAIYQAYQKVLPKRRPKFLPEAIEENERSNSPENGMFHLTDEGAEA